MKQLNLNILKLGFLFILSHFVVNSVFAQAASIYYDGNPTVTIEEEATVEQNIDLTIRVANYTNPVTISIVGNRFRFSGSTSKTFTLSSADASTKLKTNSNAPFNFEDQETATLVIYAYSNSTTLNAITISTFKIGNVEERISQKSNTTIGPIVITNGVAVTHTITHKQIIESYFFHEGHTVSIKNIHLSNFNVASNLSGITFNGRAAGTETHNNTTEIIITGTPDNTTATDLVLTSRFQVRFDPAETVTGLNGTTSPELHVLVVEVFRRGDFETAHVAEAVHINVLKSIGNRNFDAISKRAAFLSGYSAYQDNKNEINNLDDLLVAVHDSRDAINNGDMDLKEFLSGKSFNVNLGAVSSSRINVKNPIGLWGNVDLSQLDGKYFNSQTDFEGSVFNINLGLDRTFTDGTVIGLGYGHYSTNFDYNTNLPSRVNEDERFVGNYKVGLDIFQPYVSFDGVGNSKVWVALGLGVGESESSGFPANTHDKYTLKNDLVYYSYGAGMNSAVTDFYTNDGNFAQLNFKADLHGAILNSEDYDIKLDNHSFRSGLEYVTNYQLANGDYVEPTAYAVFRADKNDSETETLLGYEVNGGIRYLTGDRFTFATNIKLTSIPKTDYSEVGAILAFRVEPLNAGLGTSFTFEPSYGSDIEDENGVWDFSSNEMAKIFNKNSSNNKLNLLSELGYGIGYNGGIFTPYGKYNISNDAHTQALGFKINQGDQVRWNLSYQNSDLATKDDIFKIQYHLSN